MSQKNKKESREISRRDSVVGVNADMVGRATGSQVFSREEKPWLPDKWDKEADVVIIGYGGAGATLGLTVAEWGAKVLILEKAAFGGGNSACIAGPRFLCSTDDAKMLEYMKWMCSGQTEEDVLRAYIQRLKDIPQIYRRLGLPLADNPQPSRIDGIFPEWPAAPGAEAVRALNLLNIPGVLTAGGPILFNALAKLAEAAGVEIEYSTPAVRLVQDANTKEVLGVIADSSGKEVAVKGRKATVLACGGIEFNEEMCKQYITHCPIHFMGSPSLTGDGVRMAEEVGAQLWHMNSVSGPLYWSIKVDNNLVYATYERYDTPVFKNAGSIIWVNKYGNRFHNETAPMLTLHHGWRNRETWFSFDTEVAQFRNVPAFQIFDEKSRSVGPVMQVMNNTTPPWSKDNIKEIEKGWVVRADTIEDLALKCKFPFIEGVTRGGNITPRVLKTTLDRYNTNCKSGSDPDFRRKDFIVPIDTPPYYAIGPMFPTFVNTHGGPKHDAKQRVLDVNNRPIPRLYAIGECGSLWGPYYNGCGDVSEFFTSGLIAADNVLTETTWG